jgi:hypothetical protein
METKSRDRLSEVTRIIFYLCAIYFLLMGSLLIFLPHFLAKGITSSEINPAIIGILRGAGGSILPYSLLYLLIARSPYRREWALGVILLANILAICLDIVSLFLEEYRFSYAMIDLPVEIISASCIIVLWFKMKIKSSRWFGNQKNEGAN